MGFKSAENVFITLKNRLLIKFDFITFCIFFPLTKEINLKRFLKTSRFEYPFNSLKHLNENDAQDGPNKRYIKWEPNTKCGIERRLLDSSYDFR